MTSDPRRPIGRRRRVLPFVGLGLCALVCVVLLVAVQLRAAGDSVAATRESAGFSAPPAPTVTAASTTQNLVAVVGDEWASPRNSVSNRPWPLLLQQDLGVRVRTFASVGGAYAADAVGSGGATFASGASSIPSDATLVVFFGGARDAGDSSVELAAAATQALADAAEKAPRATLVVVGPVAQRPGRTAELRSVRSVLQVAARTARASWIDPVDEQWFDSDRFWAGSGSFPSPAGNERLEQRMAAALQPLLNSSAASPTPS